MSINTVSLALRNSPRISESTRAKVKRIAKTLGYRHNPIVSQVFSDIRKRSGGAYDQTIAVINAHIDQSALRDRPSYRKIHDGCKSRAEDSSCELDAFWLHDSELNARRLNRILQARNINGAVVLGFMRDYDCFREYASVWKRIACVSAGVLTTRRGMSCSLIDHFEVLSLAHAKSRKLGYQRPGLYIAPSIDKLLASRLSGAHAIAQASSKPACSVPTLLEKPNQKRFLQWFCKNKPDVILTFYEETRDWLVSAGVKCPEEAGVILLGERPACEKWTHVDHNGFQIGSSAIDLLLTNLKHREAGLSGNPQCLLHQPKWIDGETTREKARTGKPQS